MEIQVNNITLYYEVLGQGNPLIMVHGNGENHEIFNEAANILKNRYTVYLIDSRGHGKSSAVKEFHYQDMADDIMCFIEALNLKHVTYYGFSDGGIIGLLIASQSKLLEKMIISGANTDPTGVKKGIKNLMKVIYFFTKDAKIDLMLKEPNITNEQLENISCPVYVLAGSKDLIPEPHTCNIAQHIPHSRVNILAGQGHGSYIVHKEDIARLILEFEDSL